MLKNLLLSAALLLPATALAAPAHVTLSADKRMTIFHGAPGKQSLPNWLPPKGKTVIINTLGDDNAYNCCNGWTVSGSSSAPGLQWFAFAIKPSKNTTVTEIVEAVGNVNGGNAVTIAMYDDNGGVPGKVLAKKAVKNLDTFGNCCSVAVAKLKQGVPVTAGTTYWIAATLAKSSELSTWDAWNLSSVDTDTATAAFYNGSWNPTSAQYSAFAVYGK